MTRMDRDEAELAEALRAALTGPEPPVRTGLEDIVRRGQRKVMMRRLVAATGVIVVVGGIGIGGSMLRDLQAPGNVQVASMPTTLPSTSSAPPALPGWTRVTTSAAKPAADCANGLTLPGPTTMTTRVDGKSIDDTLMVALQKVASTAKIKFTRSSWTPGPAGTAWLDIVDAGGAGSLYLQAQTYAGTPSDAADADSYVNGTCTPPSRRTLANGAVLQLYSAEANDPGHPSQALRVYTTDHRLYVLIAEGFSSADWTQARDGESGQLIVPKGAGRRSLPLTEQQLADVGQILAANAG